MMKTIEGYSYCVSEFIGKGYSSTVHKGVKDENGEAVAIKVIELAKLEDPINQMLLEMEVAALRAMAHSPHSLRLLNVYATRNNTYLITELCEGDLATLIRSRKTIPYSEALCILAQLVSGYLDIHAAGLVHRDVKPANILYINSVFKFADFGFAIPISALGEHRGYNVGSPVYMPPEALKENNYSVSCDTWAIGIIFYQMLTGVVPWRSLNEKALYEKMINSPIHHFTSQLPPAAATFLSQILAINPLLRPTPHELQKWMHRLTTPHSQNIFICPQHLAPAPYYKRSVNMQNMSSRPHCPLLKECDSSINPLEEIKNNPFKSTQNISFKYSPSPLSQHQTKLEMHNHPCPQTQNLQNKENVLFRTTDFPSIQESFSTHQIYINSHINFKQNYPSQFIHERNLTPSRQRCISKHQTQNLKPQSKLKDQSNCNQYSKKQIFSQRDCQQSEFFMTNLTKYIHFIYRLLKFIGNPTDILLPQLEASLRKELHEKIQLALDLLKGKTIIQISSFNHFIKSQKGLQLLNKMEIWSAKDKMFFPKISPEKNVTFAQIQKAISALMKFLKQNSFNAKMILAADYLTTYFQLKKLEQKKDIVSFMRNSKIQLIMQGCPYLVKEEHLFALQFKILQMRI